MLLFPFLYVYKTFILLLTLWVLIDDILERVTLVVYHTKNATHCFQIIL